MKQFERLNLIAKNLNKSKIVKSYDSNEESESQVLAFSFLEIEESCKKLVQDLFPRLYSDTLSEEEVYNLLLDIGEEFRHILYHINDTKFYQYLNEG